MLTEEQKRSAINWQKIEAIKRLEQLLEWVKTDTMEVIDLHTVQRDRDSCLGMTIFYKPVDKWAQQLQL